MKNLNNSVIANLKTLSKGNLFILAQFFLIIFVYHTLKDLKDTIVITASDAGAEIIPFIKIWAMLPLAIFVSYLFSKIYNKLGREKSFYFFILSLLSIYLIFAYVLYPYRHELYLNNVNDFLKFHLPTGCKGLIAMITYWHFTLFYLAAEIWSLIILSVLFWGYVNAMTSLEQAKQFYPICMFIGNFAGILSGQASHFLCHYLIDIIPWEKTLQLMIFMIAICGIAIMMITQWLERENPSLQTEEIKPNKVSISFKENIQAIFQNGPLMCIAILVVGFGLTSNLIEVIWKENIRKLYPHPQAYNAYINQLTSLIGILAVIMAFLSSWIFKHFSWSKIALISPITLFTTSIFLFSALLMPSEYVSHLSSLLNTTPMVLIVTLGSIHYVLGLTAKYTLFDTSKEMAFLSIDTNERLRAKSIIDSIGSRLGKSGSSCLYQFLFIVFGSTSGYISLIGAACIFVIGISIVTTKKLGDYLSLKNVEPETTKSLQPKLI